MKKVFDEDSPNAVQPFDQIQSPSPTVHDFVDNELQMSQRKLGVATLKTNLKGQNINDYLQDSQEITG